MTLRLSENRTYAKRYSFCATPKKVKFSTPPDMNFKELVSNLRLNESNAFEIITTYLKTENAKTLTLEQLKEILPVGTSIYADADRSEIITTLRNAVEIITTWLKTENAKTLTLEQLKEILPDATSIYADAARGQIITTWLKNGKTLTLDELKEILPVGISSEAAEAARCIIITAYLKTENAKTLTLEQLKEILPLVRGTSADRSEIITTWLKNAVEIITAWLKTENAKTLTLEQLKEILPYGISGISSEAAEAARCKIITAYLETENGKTLTPEHLIKILPLVGKTNNADYFRDKIITAWLETSKDQHKSLIDILSYNFPGAGGGGGAIKYNLPRSVSIIKAINFPIKYFPKLLSDLYPSSPALAIEMLKESVVDGFFDNSKPENKSHIFEALSEIMSLPLLHDEVGNNSINQDLLKILGHQNLNLTKTELLSLVAGRLKSQYPSLSELLSQQQGLESSLNREALATVKKIFGEDLKIQDKPITLADLLSYYDARGNVKTFLGLLNPETKQTIKKQFILPDSKAFIKRNEYKKLKMLLEDDQDTKLDCPLIANLSEYLKSKIKLPTININKYQIDLSGSALPISEEEKTSLNDEFKKLLRSAIPENDKILTFIGKLIDLNEINESNKAKLCNFFRASKNNIAAAFQKEGGVNMFKSIITTLADGCAANIGNQFSKAIYQTLIEDPKDSLLFQFFDNKIFLTIINSGGDVLGSNSDPFTNSTINNNYLSPTGLAFGLSEQFDELDKVEQPIFVSDQFLQEHTKLEEKDVNAAILVMFFSDEGGAKKLSAFAAYLVIKGTMPALLKNQHLEKFKEENEKVELEFLAAVAVAAEEAAEEAAKPGVIVVRAAAIKSQGLGCSIL